MASSPQPDPELDPTRIRVAAELLKGTIPPTPLILSPTLSRLLQASVFLKCELVSPIASFKARGAFAALLRARDRGVLAGAVTSSTGNHGQGVALAASHLGVPAHIFLPRNPNPDKRAMIEQLGATIRIAGDDIDDAKDAARMFAEERRLTFVDDGDSADVIYGAGTIGLEIASQVPGPDYCFVPMGGGSLAAGVGGAFELSGCTASIIAVQSTRAPAMTHSYRAGRPIEAPSETIAEGLACRRPAPLALSGILRFVHDVVTVPDAELLRCMGLLLRSTHLLVEPAAAAGLAGALAMADRLVGKRVVLVLTGANATPDLIRRALSSSEGEAGA